MNLQANTLGYLSAFLGGVAVSFSPCIYPLIPVTLGFIGLKAGSSRLKALFLSLAYVFGLAFTYSILGLIAALTGRLFGQISSSWLSYFITGNACIIAGLSFFDILNFHSLGLRLQNKIKLNGGLFPAFILGLTSGLVAAPCTVPVLAAILVYVASRQNMLYGLSLLFVFALGMGFLLVLVGTFGALLLNLPRSAKWLNLLRRLCGLILLGAGEYFIIQAGRLMV